MLLVALRGSVVEDPGHGVAVMEGEHTRGRRRNVLIGVDLGVHGGRRRRAVIAGCTDIGRTAINISIRTGTHIGLRPIPGISLRPVPRVDIGSASRHGAPHADVRVRFSTTNVSAAPVIGVNVAGVRIERGRGRVNDGL
jgi:hypothetical protein